MRPRTYLRLTGSSLIALCLLLISASWASTGVPIGASALLTVLSLAGIGIGWWIYRLDWPEGDR